MKNIVYIFGAGASAGIDIGPNRFPTMATVLPQLREYFKSDFQELFNVIIAQGLVQEGGENEFFSRYALPGRPLNIESLMQLLEQECALYQAKHPERAKKADWAIDKLIDLTCRLLERKHRLVVSGAASNPL